MKLIPVNETCYDFVYCKVISDYYLMHSVILLFFRKFSAHWLLCMKQISRSLGREGSCWWWCSVCRSYSELFHGRFWAWQSSSQFISFCTFQRSQKFVCLLHKFYFVVPLPPPSLPPSHWSIILTSVLNFSCWPADPCALVSFCDIFV